MDTEESPPSPPLTPPPPATQQRKSILVHTPARNEGVWRNHMRAYTAKHLLPQITYLKYQGSGMPQAYARLKSSATPITMADEDVVRLHEITHALVQAVTDYIENRRDKRCTGLEFRQKYPSDDAEADENKRANALTQILFHTDEYCALMDRTSARLSESANMMGMYVRAAASGRGTRADDVVMCRDPESPSEFMFVPVADNDVPVNVNRMGFKYVVRPDQLLLRGESVADLILLFHRIERACMQADVATMIGIQSERDAKAVRLNSALSTLRDAGVSAYMTERVVLQNKE